MSVEYIKPDGRHNSPAFSQVVVTQAKSRDIADDRNVFPGANRMTAMGTAGCRCGQAYFCLIIRFLALNIEEFMALLPPVAFQHDRQAVDHYIQKAAHAQAEQNNGRIKQPLFCLENGD